MDRTRIAARVAIVTLTVLALTACAPEQHGWRVEPVVVSDNYRTTDVIFTTWNLSDDTAGGVWGESAGSWFRVAADGETTRFNDEVGRSMLDIAALTPTEVYVVRPIGSGVLNTSVELFDTDTRTFSPVLARSRLTDAALPLLPYTPDGPIAPESAFGPVTAIDVDSSGRVVFVERTMHPRTEVNAYVVRRLGRSGELETLAGEAPVNSQDATGLEQVTLPPDGSSARGVTLTAASVSLTAGADNGIVLSTPDGIFRVDDAGLVTQLAGALPQTSARLEVLGFGSGPLPVRPIDANSAGELLLIKQPPGVAESPEVDRTERWHFDGGSDRFRELVEQPDDWALGSAAGDLMVTDATGAPFPPVAAMRAGRLGVWTDERQFVVIIPGSGDESALAHFTLPPADD